MFLSLTFLPPNDQGVEPNLQMIICQDAPQVCQVNKIIFLPPRKSEASRSQLSSLCAIGAIPSRAASSASPASEDGQGEQTRCIQNIFIDPVSGLPSFYYFFPPLLFVFLLDHRVPASRAITGEKWLKLSVVGHIFLKKNNF